MKYLFIGGEKDGQRVNISRPSPRMRFYKKPDVPPRLMDISPRGDSFETIEYALFSLRGEKEVHEFYGLVGMTADEMMARLIERYT